jgi:biopolymer transport protein ExbD
MKIRGKQSDDIAVDMSPMIDMVFLLLIFFLVASQIVNVEKVPVEVPSAAYAKVPEDETGRFPITVNEDDRIFVGPGGAQEVDVDDLTRILSAQVAADPEIKVVIRGDKTVQYETIEKIMTEACAQAGVVDMIFAAFEK